jgi:hypothetical protein
LKDSVESQHSLLIEGKNIHSISGFYKEINRVFMTNEEWQIGESLDAFNDLLYGGFGVLHQSDSTDIIWNDIAVSSASLGFETTKQYYLDKLRADSPYNIRYHTEQLEKLESGKGKTYFDIVLEIIDQHQRLNLIAR